jgi:hypothetical protein
MGACSDAHAHPSRLRRAGFPCALRNSRKSPFCSIPSEAMYAWSSTDEEFGPGDGQDRVPEKA